MLGDNTPLVSVIIPTYGRANLLNRAIDSVLTQTYENIEIIVVNDNKHTSEHYQPTMISLQQYETNPKVKVIADGNNVGGSLARNKGIEISQGEFISFLDDDDFYYKNKVEQQLNHILENDIDVSVCDMDVMQDHKILKETNKNKAIVEGVANFIINGNVYTPMIFCKKYVLDEIQMFTDTPRFQDHVVMLKIISKRFKVCELRKKLFVHNEHPNERISFSSRSEIAYNIRRNYEGVLLDRLNDSELRMYNLKLFYQDVFLLKKKYFLEFIENFFTLLFDVKSINEFIFLLKILAKYILKG